MFQPFLGIVIELNVATVLGKFEEAGTGIVGHHYPRLSHFAPLLHAYMLIFVLTALCTSNQLRARSAIRQQRK